MIETVLVVGGGNAGFLAAMTLKVKVPRLAVTVVRSPEIGVIGVGESTTVALPNHLHGYLGIDPTEFHRKAMPSWKLGIRFLWGSRKQFDYTFGLQMDWKWEKLSKNNGFYCTDVCDYVDLPSALMSHNKVFVRRPDGLPAVTRNVGYHIDNPRFVTFIEAKAREMGVEVVDGLVEAAESGEAGVKEVILATGQRMTADLFVDCSGFRALLLGKCLGEPFVPYKSTLFCDRAVTSSWRRTDEEILPYTVAETMNAGWCWQIDHPDSTMRGYVYSSAFLSDEEAEREFREKNPKVQTTRFVKFVSGRYGRTWVKNVVAVENSSGFVEPLESTALAIICDESRLLAECLFESDRRPSALLIDHYNRINARAWDTIRGFLGIHYKFNTRLDTPFWQACRADADVSSVAELLDYYAENGPSTFARTSLLHGNDIFGMEGYLALLVGQQVPYKARYTPTAAEQAVFNGIRAENRMKALTAMTVREALDVIEGPRWQWPAGFFTKRAVQALTPTQLTSYVGEV